MIDPVRRHCRDNSTISDPIHAKQFDDVKQDLGRLV